VVRLLVIYTESGRPTVVVVGCIVVRILEWTSVGTSWRLLIS
jgi:hypothetical protein